MPELETYAQKITLKNYTTQQVIIMGSAGMRIVTAADILCVAGLLAGMNVSMKTDYNITVLKGQSVGEVLISPEKINYTGIESPTVVLALSDEGVVRRKHLFKHLLADTFVLKDKSVQVPDSKAPVISFDFKALKFKEQDWALASLGILAAKEKGLNHHLLMLAVKQRFDKARLPGVLKTLDKIKGVNPF
jgi:Pyruvate/2-oxoacid:ferredoxin oxidoreductase gamma subunit